MRNFILSSLFLLFIITTKAQNITISGKVEAPNNKPIENVTIYLLKKKDSSIIHYTSASKEGNFSLKTTAFNEPTLLRLEAEHYLPYSRIFDKIDNSISLDKIILEKDTVSTIEEVKILSSAVKIKNDTIEFNASALKVSPDSKIEELLKKIPGIEIDNDGKITANGKEVDQIMINGKPFFDKEGKIALKNLPAEIIKNIQITTSKSKEEELSGKKSKSINSTINFNIDEKKNKGLISRITIGLGTQKRYEGSVLSSYFKKDTKISLLASSNNINSQGFSNDEIFDSMGNGRNSWLMQGGSFITNGKTTYFNTGIANKGIQKSTTVGANYSDKISKETDLDKASVIFIDNNLESKSKSSRNTLLPNYTLQTSNEQNGENENRRYSFDTSIQIKLDSLTSIYISPNFTKTEAKSFNNSRSKNSKNNVLLNENLSSSLYNNDSYSYDANLYLNRKLAKKGRSISMNMFSSISQSKSKVFDKSSTIFYQDATLNDLRNQLSDSENSNHTYQYRMGYTEPISDSANIEIEINYGNIFERSIKNVNDYNAASESFTHYNDLLSNDMQQIKNEFSPEISFSYNKSKFNIWSSASVNMVQMKINSYYNQQEYQLNKNFVFPQYNINVTFNPSQNKSVSLYHAADFSIPSSYQLTPYIDFSNPLVSYEGNPNLKPIWNNRTYLYFRNNNLVKNSSYYFNLGLNYQNNNVTNYSYYDDFGKQFITYTNVNGNKNAYLGTGYTKSYKWKENKLSINPKFNCNYNYNKGFIEGQEFISHSYTISPGINFTYEIKDKLTIKPSYSLNYRISKYSNYSIDKIQNSTNSLKLELTNYFLETNIIFGNDFQYTTNSNIAPGFKKDFYFWNTSLGYSFYKKQFTAKLKIYDVLNQNQSITRNISSSYIEDREDLILKRYFMFSLTMKLNKFAGKK